MTREEAITLIKPIMLMMKNPQGEGYYALEMAIQALEQDPKKLYDKGYADGMRALAVHIELCKEEQEPKTDELVGNSEQLDCISRQAVEDAMYDATRSMDLNYGQIMSYIDEIPSVKQEPKTGHWIFKNYNWHCSECDETPKTLGYVGNADFMREHFKFCNHCGAKMESEG